MGERSFQHAALQKYNTMDKFKPKASITAPEEVHCSGFT